MLQELELQLMTFLKQTPMFESVGLKVDRACVLSDSSTSGVKSIECPVGSTHPPTRVQLKLKNAKSIGLHLQMDL